MAAGAAEWSSAKASWEHCLSGALASRANSDNCLDLIKQQFIWLPVQIWTEVDRGPFAITSEIKLSYLRPLISSFKGPVVQQLPL